MIHKAKQAQCARPDFFQFQDQRGRDQYFNICVNLAKHIKKNKIEGIFLLDNGARPAANGLKIAWRKLYPGEALPKIMFLNPYGFLTENYKQHLESLNDDLHIDLTLEKAVLLIQNDQIEQPTLDNIEQIASQNRVNKSMESLLKKHGLNKKSNLMVFDTCLHSGTTVKPLLHSLNNEVKLENLSFGLATNFDTHNCSIRNRTPVDFSCINEKTALHCAPFGQQKVSRKTFDNIHSRLNRDPESGAQIERTHYKDLMGEIKLLMHQGFENNS